MSHLSAAFGLPEVCAELIELLDVPEFERAWLQYCELYNAPAEEQKAALGQELRRHQPAAGARAAHGVRGVPQEGRRSSRRAPGRNSPTGRAGYGPRQQFAAKRIEAPAVLNPVDEAPGHFHQLERAVGTCGHRVPGVHALLRDVNGANRNA